MATTVDIIPKQTLYIKNIYEKIGAEGMPSCRIPSHVGPIHSRQVVTSSARSCRVEEVPLLPLLTIRTDRSHSVL
jgi:hypothetical protein